MIRNVSLTLAVAMGLAGCQSTTGPDVTRFIKPSVVSASEIAPAGAEPGVCWGHEPGPEVTSIVTQTVMVEDATFDAEGRETSPPIYRKVRAPKVINDGSGRWFERVCDDQYTPTLVETLQRALSVRGYYTGAVSGIMDPTTQAAIRKYQSKQGLDSDMLSLSAAQQLGLIAIELEPEIVDG